jgi:Protein of unknown function (DUF1469).
MDTLNDFISDSKKDLTSFVDLKLKIYQLTLYEKVGNLSSLLTYGLIILLVVYFSILFIFIALGFFLGSVLNNIALGMLLVAILYLIILGLLFVFREKIKGKLADIFITEMRKNDNQDENEQ